MNSNHNKAGLITVLMFCKILLFSQEPGLIFRNLNIQNGLSNDNVQCIYQDREGFMWFGTERGIDKYDGKEFKSFLKSLKDSNDNATRQLIFSICEDSYGGLWFINDSNGLILMNKAKGTLHKFDLDPKKGVKISYRNPRKILEDKYKNIWVSTLGGGLKLFNRKDSTFTYFMHDSADIASVGSNNLTLMKEDKNGIIWIVSTDGLLIRFDPVSRKFENIRIFNERITLWNNINSPAIYIDSEDNIWIAHQERIYKYNQYKKTIKKYQINLKDGNPEAVAFITSLIELNKSEFLISTFGKGLYIYNTNTGKYIQYYHNPANPFGVCSNRISQLYKSKEGVIWIGSYDNGLSIYSKNSVRFPQIIQLVNIEFMENSNKSTFSFCEITGGKILMGTEDNGVFQYDPFNRSMIRVLSQLQNYSVFDLYKDDKDNIWIPCASFGLYIYNYKINKLERINSLYNIPKSFLNNLVRVYIDKKDRLWLGNMSNGLISIDRNNGNTRIYFNEPQISRVPNVIFKIFEDSKGNIWIASAHELNIFDEKTKSFNKITDNNDGSFFYDIYEDNESRIWACSNKGLLLFMPETKKFRTFNLTVNGVNLNLYKIIEDNGYFWFGTLNGIACFDTKTFKFNHFGKSDGIDYIEYNPTSGFKSKSGLLYLGNHKGVTVFDPASISWDTLAPPVSITEFRVNDVPVNLNKKGKVLSQFRLNYNQSTLKFKFAALNFSNPDANQYKYKLVGYDKDWIPAGNSNIAYYPNLPPRKYVFKVIASNSHGIWNLEGKEMTVFIMQPLWRKLWFRITLVILIVTIILLLYYNRIYNLNHNKLVLEGIVKERTKELNIANQELTEQHEEMVQQHEEISAQNELLSEMSQEILKQNEELEQHRSNLEKLVIERTKELEIAVEKAKESDLLKSAFLANMSHEIRTPMNTIVGFSNLLKDSDLNLSERNEFIDLINSNSETLLVLIDDILDLSLIEANQLSIKKGIFNINEMLDNLYSSFSLINKKENLVILLNNQLHNLNLKVNSDQIRIRQILSNFLNNSYKFTEKGSVELGLCKEDDFLRFYIKDTGIGIEEKEIDAIFERFRKSEVKSNTLYRGAGLGLAISKALSTMLGGSLRVESSLGTGSVFSFLLPWSCVTKENLIIEEVFSQKNDNKMNGKDILVVEDEEANYLYVNKVLTRMEFNVHWAENGEEAIKMANSGINFHLILMDIKMPVMDGFEATKLIKANNPSQIIIALTAYARPEDRVHFMKAGFNDYLSKPIKPNDLMSIIKRYL